MEVDWMEGQTTGLSKTAGFNNAFIFLKFSIWIPDITYFYCVMAGGKYWVNKSFAKRYFKGKLTLLWLMEFFKHYNIEPKLTEVMTKNPPYISKEGTTTLWQKGLSTSS